MKDALQIIIEFYKKIESERLIKMTVNKIRQLLIIFFISLSAITILLTSFILFFTEAMKQIDQNGGIHSTAYLQGNFILFLLSIVTLICCFFISKNILDDKKQTPEYLAVFDVFIKVFAEELKKELVY